ncbi:hypothetical protein [Parachryseolinea silvisoli]|uniref:hypothetical protein n=1 Tax=Parachryseolinea silvisoli TaxID=2873601 RepID=UPI002265F89B|nr:hypothetical protein [Parachryseolinea silvisoli]MCD9014448.1 hypothetical protein [Parachryseolinea silvisoli]
MPEYLRGVIGEWKATRYIGIERDYSAEAFPVGPNSLILRSLNTATKSYELAKKSSSGLMFNLNLINKQIDGIFCSDGKLVIDKATHQVIYIHYYRNELIVCDTLLNLKFRGHTIDTFSRAQLKIAKLGGDGKSMISEPPRQININAAAFNNVLYIHSNILSFEEDMHDFITKSVVDMYDLRDGQYLESFYIPDYEDIKVSSFIVSEDKIFAIHGKYIVSYLLPMN